MLRYCRLSVFFLYFIPPTHPFLPYAAPHFSHISHFICFGPDGSPHAILSHGRRIRLRSPFHDDLREAAARAASACDEASGLGPCRRMCTNTSIAPFESPQREKNWHVTRWRTWESVTKREEMGRDRECDKRERIGSVTKRDRMPSVTKRDHCGKSVTKRDRLGS